MTSRQSYSVARQQMLLSQTNPVGIELFSYVNIFSGGSFFWVKKKITEGRKACRASKTKPVSPLNSRSGSATDFLCSNKFSWLLVT